MKSDKTKFLKGKLLLDSGLLANSFFSHSAVLVCEHDVEGTLGVMLNHPNSFSINKVVVANIADSLREHVVHLGGPVLERGVLYLVRNPYSTEHNSLHEIVPGLFFGSSIDDITEEDLVAKPEDILFFAGITGWSKNQLEGEIEDGGWIVSDITVAEVFSPHPLDLWKEKIRSLGDDYLLLSHSARDSHAN